MEVSHNTLKAPEGTEETSVKSPGKPKTGKNRFRMVLEGSFLTRDIMIRQLPYLVVITLMGMAYIFNSNYADKTVIQISRTKNELEELRFNYINTKSKLMQATRQSELVHRLEARGVRESKIPPRKIIIQESSK